LAAASTQTTWTGGQERHGRQAAGERKKEEGEKGLERAHALV